MRAWLQYNYRSDFVQSLRQSMINVRWMNRVIHIFGTFIHASLPWSSRATHWWAQRSSQKPSSHSCSTSDLASAQRRHTIPVADQLVQEYRISFLFYRSQNGCKPFFPFTDRFQNGCKGFLSFNFLMLRPMYQESASTTDAVMFYYVSPLARLLFWSALL